MMYTFINYPGFCTVYYFNNLLWDYREGIVICKTRYMTFLLVLYKDNVFCALSLLK